METRVIFDVYVIARAHTLRMSNVKQGEESALGGENDEGDEPAARLGEEATWGKG